MEEVKIELGKMYRDTITDFIGTATAYFTQLTGSDRVQLEGKDSTGRPIEVWLDISRIK